MHEYDRATIGNALVRDGDERRGACAFANQCDVPCVCVEFDGMTERREQIEYIADARARCDWIVGWECEGDARIFNRVQPSDATQVRIECAGIAHERELRRTHRAGKVGRVESELVDVSKECA
jgi:hypothetical protein